MRLVKQEIDFLPFLYGIDLALAKPFIANYSCTCEYFKTHNILYFCSDQDELRLWWIFFHWYSSLNQWFVAAHIVSLMATPLFQPN
jgi:hypothetical protein